MWRLFYHINLLERRKEISCSLAILREYPSVNDPIRGFRKEERR
jgi:hypothetical protein